MSYLSDTASKRGMPEDEMSQSATLLIGFIKKRGRPHERERETETGRGQDHMLVGSGEAVG